MTVQALLEQERYFREHRREIATATPAVLDELFTRFTPSLTREQLISNAKAMNEAAARDEMVYTTYGSLSTSEIMSVADAQREAGKGTLLGELKAIDNQAQQTYRDFQDLSRRRAELALAINESGVPQTDIAKTLGVTRQRAFALIKQGRDAQHN